MPTAVSVADYLTSALTSAVGERLPETLEVRTGTGGPAGGDVVVAVLPGRMTVEVWPMLLDAAAATVSFTAVTLDDPRPGLLDRLLRRRRVRFGITVLDEAGTTVDEAWMLHDAQDVVRAVAQALADRAKN